MSSTEPGPGGPGPTPSAAPPLDRAAAISRELAELLDEHLGELRSRGVSDLVLAPLESELRRYTA